MVPLLIILAVSSTAAADVATIKQAPTIEAPQAILGAGAALTAIGVSGLIFSTTSLATSRDGDSLTVPTVGAVVCFGLVTAGVILIAYVHRVLGVPPWIPSAGFF